MTTHRERALGQARADLVSLPGLVDQLDPTERNHDVSGFRGKVVGSPALVHLEVIHLLHGGEHKPWYGEDPRYADMTERYKAALVLAGWTRILAEEMPEFPDLTEHPTVRSEADVLVEHWPWISDQQWATELARDVAKVATRVRNLLGIRAEYRPSCRWCPVNPATGKRPPVNPVEANTHKITTWEACAYGLCADCGRTYPKGPALDALAHVQEPMTLAAISGILGVPVKTLHRWHADQLIVPVNGKQRGRVFDLAAVRGVANVKFGRKVG